MALIQLVATGIQDQILTGNPTASYFQPNCDNRSKNGRYHRHTNFSMEPIPIESPFPINFGRTTTFTILRAADLLSKLYLRAELSGSYRDDSKWAWKENIGYTMIDQVELTCRGQVIQKIRGEDLRSISAISPKLLDILVGNTRNMTAFKKDHSKKILYIPLDFWFSSDYFNSLPLIALQYHEVRVTIKIRSLEECIIDNSENFELDKLDVRIEGELVGEYVYLDTNERRKMSQLKQEYIVRNKDEETGKIKEKIFIISDSTGRLQNK